MIISDSCDVLGAESVARIEIESNPTLTDPKLDQVHAHMD